MQHAVGTGRPGRHRRAVAVAATGVTALLALSACTTGGTTTGGGSQAAHTSSAAAPSSSARPSPKPVLAASISTLPSAGAKDVDPAQPVTVKVAHGTLTSVVMTNPVGKKVAGKIDSGGSSWSTTEDLGYSKTYKVVATAHNSKGTAVVKRTHITTVTPANMTLPYMQRAGGYPLGNGQTYGVGIVPVVHFDEPIHHPGLAEQALKVTTSPHVSGAWFWSDNQDAHWRPEHYWPAGTKVTVTAKAYGHNFGGGLYGQSDVTGRFTVGRRQITIAHDTAPHSVNKVRVYNAAGKVLRTMNTSMGEHSGETVKGQYINFYTLDGDYTVLDHENPAKMCSDTYGLPASAPGGYGCEDIPWSTKISVDGIYLHELDATVWAQNSGEDVSHGCLNLDYSNAHWFFNHTIPGDPVIIHGAKGAPKIQVWEGGDWSVPWSTWVKGGNG